jgi:hypothetical protein
VITDGMGLNITVMSYRGSMDFGIVADREQMPDLWKVMDWLRDALEELKPAGVGGAGARNGHQQTESTTTASRENV